MMIQPTSEKAAEYLWFGKKCLEHARATGSSGTRAFVDGIYTIICKYTPHKAILIDIGGGKFLSHPRSGSLKLLPYFDNEMNQYYLAAINGGGYGKNKDGWYELANRTPYPLQDNDRGTFLIDGDDKSGCEVEWAGSDSENYGNIWWIGQGENPPVVSWRGPPNILLTPSATLSIPGLTALETNFGDKPAYTCFGVDVYQSGSVLATCPSIAPPLLGGSVQVPNLVAGAAIAYNGQLLCAVVSNYGDYSAGFKLTVAIYNGSAWRLLSGQFDCGKLRTPAFFSSDAKTLILDNKKYQISDDLQNVTCTGSADMTASGTRTIVGTGGYSSEYHYNGNAKLWPGMTSSGGIGVTTLTATAAFTGSGSSGQTTTKKRVPVYTGNPATDVIVYPDGSKGPGKCQDGNDYLEGFTAEANGAYCSMQWSGVQCFEGNRATRKIGTCNDSFSITVTLQPQGITGTYSRAVRVEEVALIGPLQPYVGAGYILQNAQGYVTWTISGGTMSAGGTITSLTDDMCMQRVVTGTDACGASASLTLISLSCPEHTYHKKLICDENYTDGVFETLEADQEAWRYYNGYYKQWIRYTGFTRSILSPCCPPSEQGGSHAPFGQVGTWTCACTAASSEECS